MKVKEAMHKGVEWREPATPISEIAKVMRENDVGAVPIAENDRLVGIITDRDITCRAVAKSIDLAKTTAGNIMTKRVVYCTENEDIEDAIHLMENSEIRRLPKCASGMQTRKDGRRVIIQPRKLNMGEPFSITS